MFAHAFILLTGVAIVGCGRTVTDRLPVDDAPCGRKAVTCMIDGEKLNTNSIRIKQHALLKIGLELDCDSVAAIQSDWNEALLIVEQAGAAQPIRRVISLGHRSGADGTKWISRRSGKVDGLIARLTNPPGQYRMRICVRPLADTVAAARLAAVHSLSGTVALASYDIEIIAGDP